MDVIVATNLIANPGLESGSSTGWLSNNGTLYPLAISTTTPIKGSYSMLSTRAALTGTGDTSAASAYLGTTGGVQFPVTGSQFVTASLDVKAEQTNRIGRIYVLFYRSDNTTNGMASANGRAVALTPNVVSRLAITAQVPADCVKAFVIVTIDVASGMGNAVQGERVWMDNLRVSQGGATLDAVNLMPNPGLGDTAYTGTLNYWSSNNATYYPGTLDSGTPISGRYSYRTDRTASSPSTTASSINLNGPGTGSVIVCTPGTPYSSAVDVKPANARRAMIYYQWFNSAGTYTGDGVRSSYLPLPANTVTRLSWTDTPPAGAVGLRFTVNVYTTDLSNALLGEQVWYDNAMVNAGATPLPYFTGHNLPDGAFVYTWAGNAGSSNSQRWKVTDAAQTGYAYFDGDTVATDQYRYAWSGTARASTSERHQIASGRVKVWNGTTWQQKPMKAWNGAGWVEKPVRIWTGSTWKILN